jgi:hypothetical protein
MSHLVPLSEFNQKCEIANFGKLKSDPASITVAKAIANEISKADWNKLWGFLSRC